MYISDVRRQTLSDQKSSLELSAMRYRSHVNILIAFFNVKGITYEFQGRNAICTSAQRSIT